MLMPLQNFLQYLAKAYRVNLEVCPLLIIVGNSWISSSVSTNQINTNIQRYCIRITDNVNISICDLIFKKLSQITQELKSNSLLNIKPTFLCYLNHQTHGYTVDGQVCFHRWLFIDPIKPWKCTTGPMEPVNGINKDVSGPDCCKQLSRPILWIKTVSVTYWRYSIAVCVLLEGIIHLQLPTYLHHPPNPLPPASLLICTMHDITVTVKK